MNRLELLNVFVNGDGKFSHNKGVIYNKEQVNEILSKPGGRITEIIYTDDKGDDVTFFTNNHLFGYPHLGDDFCPCSMTLPISCVARPGCEDGVINSLDKYIAVHPRDKILYSYDELLDYLETINKVEVVDFIDFVFDKCSADKMWDRTQYGTETFKGKTGDGKNQIVEMESVFAIGSLYCSGKIGNGVFNLYYRYGGTYQYYLANSQDEINKMERVNNSGPYYDLRKGLNKLIREAESYN